MRAHKKHHAHSHRWTGRFQAIQQQLALLGGEAAAADIAARSACRALDRRGAAFVEIATAKIRTGEAAGKAAAIAALLAHKVPVDTKESIKGQTALMWAVSGGHLGATQTLLAAGAGATRSTPGSGALRAAYCLMGVCFECLVEVDGVPNRQGCLVAVTEGMAVRRQNGAATLTEDAS